MAKALFGHVGGPDSRLLAEVAMLRRRVRDLEAEVLRLSAENDALLRVEAATADDIISLDSQRESATAPALA
jgi:hypothetical protein